MVRMQPQHRAVMLDILDEAASWLSARGIDQWRPDQFRVLIDRGDTYLALLDGEAVGTLALHWHDAIDERLWHEVANVEEAGYVHRLAVRRAFAGKGIGWHLLRWAEGMVAAAGKSYLRLDCMAENPALCAYYERAGFTYRGEVQGKGWKARLYEKKI
jgi:ribosomal protein S18 acetylase RimI-like enzyme